MTTTTNSNPIVTAAEINELREMIAKIERAFPVYAEVVGISDPEAFSYREIDGDEICFEGEKYCRGYYEPLYATMPIDYLHDPAGWLVSREEWKRQQAVEKEARERAEAEAKQAAKDARDLATYEQLRARFEGTNV